MVVHNWSRSSPADVSTLVSSYYPIATHDASPTVVFDSIRHVTPAWRDSIFPSFGERTCAERCSNAESIS